jgi:CBS domain-containing protein
MTAKKNPLGNASNGNGSQQKQGTLDAIQLLQSQHKTIKQMVQELGQFETSNDKLD